MASSHGRHHARWTRLRAATAKLPGALTERDPLLFAHPYYWAPFIIVGDRLPS